MRVAEAGRPHAVRSVPATLRTALRLPPRPWTGRICRSDEMTREYSGATLRARPRRRRATWRRCARSPRRRASSARAGRWRGSGLSDAAAEKDMAELRELLGAWRDAKRSVWKALIGWVARMVLALVLVGLAVRLGFAGYREVERFAGYAAVFDARRSRRRRGARGGVCRVPAAVPLLWQHRGEPVGRVERIEEDARGLRVIGAIDDPAARGVGRGQGDRRPLLRLPRPRGGGRDGCAN